MKPQENQQISDKHQDKDCKNNQNHQHISAQSSQSVNNTSSKLNHAHPSQIPYPYPYYHPTQHLMIGQTPHHPYCPGYHNYGIPNMYGGMYSYPFYDYRYANNSVENTKIMHQQGYGQILPPQSYSYPHNQYQYTQKDRLQKEKGGRHSLASQTVHIIHQPNNITHSLQPQMKMPVVSQIKNSPTLIKPETCKCAKSSCLKQYCVCYKNGIACSTTCSCHNCKNNENQLNDKRNPKGPKTTKCKCSKSQCLKKYCQCFSANKKCQNCLCIGCQNTSVVVAS